MDLGIGVSIEAFVHDLLPVLLELEVSGVLVVVTTQTESVLVGKLGFERDQLSIFRVVGSGLVF